MSERAVKGTHPGSLLSILGVAFGIAAGVGTSIGGGILRTPGIVADHVPHASLMIAVWILGALYCLMWGNLTAELATAMPKAGGHYVYIRRAWGEFAGFVFGWADWTLNACAIAFIAVASAEYLLLLFPQLSFGVGGLASALIAVIAILHLAGLRVGGTVQQVLSLAKVAGFLGVAVVCLLAPQPAAMAATPAQPPAFNLLSLATFSAFFLSWQLVQEAYAGFDSPIYFSEENRHPGRDVPRAIFGSVLTAATVYLLINVAILHLMSPAQIAGSKLALADAVRLVIGGAAGTWITVLGLVALLGVANASLLFAPRILLAIGRDGLFTERATTVTDGGTPSIALFITAAAASLLSMTGSFERLFTMVSFLGVTISLGSMSAYFLLRRREPDLPRPYRAIGHPVLPVMAVLTGISLWTGSLLANPRSALYGLALVAFAYPAFRFAQARRDSTAPLAVDERP